MPSPVGTLYVGLVLSSKPHAKLLAVDASEALKVAGVVRFMAAGDLSPARNTIGVLAMDEQVFAVDEVSIIESAALAERNKGGGRRCTECRG